MSAARLIERLNALDEIRLWADVVNDELKETPGGDAFEYHGGMNPVEYLRVALEKYQTLIERMEMESGDA